MNPVFTTIGKVLVHPGMHTALGIANLTVSSIDLKKTCDVESKISSANSNFADTKKSIEVMNENVDNACADISSLRLSTKGLPKLIDDTNGTLSRIDKLFAECNAPTPQPTVPTPPPASNPGNQQTYDAVYHQGYNDAIAKVEADKKAAEAAAAAKAREDAKDAEIASLRQQLTQATAQNQQPTTPPPTTPPAGSESNIFTQFLAQMKANTDSVNTLVKTMTEDREAAREATKTTNESLAALSELMKGLQDEKKNSGKK